MHYLEHLTKDKKLQPLLRQTTPVVLKQRKNICNYLCASIMSQQLSVKVADVIYNRFIQLYDGKEPTADQIMATPSITLRNIGLSNAKVSYVKNVAAFELDQGLDSKKLRKMENEEVINYVTQIKGVGRWTAEMLLMFALGREDVFAVDDLGIQQAMIQLYKLDTSDKKEFKKSLLKHSAKWAPYRTYACIHLWQWKDNAPLYKKKKPT